MGQLVSVIHPQPTVGLIRIDRPERRNALNMAVKQSIADSIVMLEGDPDIRVIVISGGPDYFVAGTDIAEMKDMTPQSHAALGTNIVFERLRACTKPVIAAVEGYALGGGCELAMACDMIVAGRDARFSQTEIKVGIMPGAGGTQMLLRTAGKHRAMYLCLTGDPFTAEEAMAFGLLSRLVDSGQAEAEAVTLAQRIAAMPQLAVKAIKEAIRQGMDTPLVAALAYERRLFETLFASEDQSEGMAAFLEKRRPRFSGR